MASVKLPWGKSTHPLNPYCDPNSLEYRELAGQFTLQYPTDPPSMYRDPRDPSRTKNRELWRAKMTWERDRSRHLRSRKRVQRPCEICGHLTGWTRQDRHPLRPTIKLGRICRTCDKHLFNLNVASPFPGVTESDTTLHRLQRLAYAILDVRDGHQPVYTLPLFARGDFPCEGIVRYLRRYRTKCAGRCDARQQLIAAREARRAERQARS